MRSIQSSVTVLEVKVQNAFVQLLPTIQSVVRTSLRLIRCSDRKEDLLCEAVAISWKWYRRLVGRGRDPAEFIVTFARLAARAVLNGRRLAGQVRARDAYSRMSYRKGGFNPQHVSPRLLCIGTPFAEALADNTQSPVPQQVQFRCDFPAWRNFLPLRKQQIIALLALGHRTKDVADAMRITPARVSQMRSEFQRDYLQFLDGNHPRVRKL